MFSKKTVIILGVICAIAINIIILSITSRNYPTSGAGRIAVSLIAPFQEATSGSIRFFRTIWQRYFNLVNVAEENVKLEQALGEALSSANRLREIELSNRRLRELLNFKDTVSRQFLAAEVIGKDPSTWFKTVIVDKGWQDGVQKGRPVVIPEGIAGQVIDAAKRYSKVLLIIDQNSAVDALVQRTRARGIVRGQSSNRCVFDYVLRKHDLQVGDTVISSGLDGIYPKGLRVGTISRVVRRNAGIFQEVAVTPFVDFEKLEEVLIVLEIPDVPPGGGE